MRFVVILTAAAFLLAACGCSFGSWVLEKSHGSYNESFVRVDSEELLLNIVRTRYNDPRGEIEVSAIAAQYELSAQAESRPFFSTESTSSNIFRSFSTVLPGASVNAMSRPTLSLTPVQSGETTARYMRPMTMDTLTFFAETSWPISTIFRLWLDGMNGLPNAPSASGPTRSFAPEFEEFRRAVHLMQSIQNQGHLTFRKVEEELPGDPIAIDRISGADLIEARKAGHEYCKTPDGKAWRLVRKVQKLYLDLKPESLTSPEYLELIQLLRLKPGLTRYEIIQGTVGFERKADAPPSTKIILATRSLVQVMFFVSHAVEVPAEHLASGVVKSTYEADGRTLFDWHKVTDGLFTVKAVRQKNRPACAAVAVLYRGYWFYIDDRDDDTKSAFTLVGPTRRLDLGIAGGEKRSSSAPTLTLPVGGR